MPGLSGVAAEGLDACVLTLSLRVLGGDWLGGLDLGGCGVGL